MADNTSLVSRTIWARYGKRVFDVLISAGLLVILSPLLLLTIIMVKLTGPGPVFFSQVRAGKHGELFQLLKFRTMRADRTPDPKELIPLDHPDITPLGRALRRLKIDESPQLIHVLGGRMSLIGPRPTLPDQVEAYDDFRRQRLLVRPGITGLAQISCGSDTQLGDVSRKLDYDIDYIKKRNLIVDIIILLSTFKVVSTPNAENNSVRLKRFIKIS